MNWLNLETKFLHTPEYIGCDPKQRGTWTNVSLWCAQQENGGRIVDSIEWKDRQWQQTCGVTAKEVREAAPLLTWEQNDLIVWGYPVEQESLVKVKRDNARLNGKHGGRPLKHITEEKPALVTSLVSSLVPALAPTLKPVSESVRERNGREGKEKELIHGADAPHVLTLSADSEPKPGPKKTRTRNPLLDALAIIDGSNVNQVTPSAWAVTGKALADIKTVTADVTPDEIARRAAIYRAKHRDWALTPSALAKHWANCDRTSNFSPAPARINANEPKGWKAYLDTHLPESVYSRGNEHAEKTWAQLDRQTQDWITSQMNDEDVKY